MLHFILAVTKESQESASRRGLSKEVFFTPGSELKLSKQSYNSPSHNIVFDQSNLALWKYSWYWEVANELSLECYYIMFCRYDGAKLMEGFLPWHVRYRTSVIARPLSHVRYRTSVITRPLLLVRYYTIYPHVSCYNVHVTYFGTRWTRNKTFLLQANVALPNMPRCHPTCFGENITIVHSICH